MIETHTADESRRREKALQPRPRIPQRLIAGWCLVVGGVVGCALLRERMEMMAWANLAALTFFTTSKAATLLRLEAGQRRRLSRIRLLAYLLWPGMRPEPFLGGRPRRRNSWDAPGSSTWCAGRPSSGSCRRGCPRQRPGRFGSRSRLSVSPWSSFSA